jgi:thiol-disulfide isomerase/thioredoxin
MISHKFILTLGILMVHTILHGQGSLIGQYNEAEHLRNLSIGLQIGDKLPRRIVTNLINNKGKSISTADFGNKLLIIDFWSIYCSSCVQALPELQKLQNKYYTSLSILPVTTDQKKIVQPFWLANKYTKNLSIPSVVEDTVFSKYFKFLYLPHEIWIYKGKVVGITSADYLDEENVKKVLAGEKLSFPIKNDFLSYNKNTRLFKVDSKQVDTSKIIKYATITGYTQGINSTGLTGGWGIVKDEANKTVRTYLLNMPIYTAFIILNNAVGYKDKLARPTSYLSQNQITWDDVDSTKYRYFNKSISGYEQDWIRNNGLCFESVDIDSGLSNQQLAKRAILQLNQLLGLDVNWIKRVETIWHIETDGSNKPIKVARDGINLTELVAILNEHPAGPYVFNHSTSTSLVDRSLASINNFNDLQKGLLRFGFNLVKRDTIVDKLRFSTKYAMLPDFKEIQDYKNNGIIDSRNGSVDSVTNIEFIQNLNKRSDVKILSSGYRIEIIKDAKGARPNIDSKVMLHYKGMFINGQIFDSSYQYGIPVEYIISKVSPALKEVLMSMNAGSKYLLYVPSASPNGISNPATTLKTTLIFEIDFQKIIRNR